MTVIERNEKWATPTFLRNIGLYVCGVCRMKNEFVLAFNEVLEEKGLPKEIILQAIESAMVSAYRRAVNAPAPNMWRLKSILRAAR